MGFMMGFPNWKDSWCCGGESEPKGNHSMTSSRDKWLLPFQHDSLLEFLISPWPCKLVPQSTHLNFQVPSYSLFFTASFICWLQLDKLQRFFFWQFFWSNFDLKNMILTSGFFFDKYFYFQNFPDWQSLITRF